ncbi:hypothetical protein JF535_12400 [Microbulbifer salipaludis]|uniref:Uncharacterized protein n=1 Tax=Microbulbifer salipaludis TaxID=187980 RepID=A0ABS3E9C1_9GAMM|nr:hypothetical protein [Microbulbifer salipaludis]MBN8431654.1 hypothetical protein [Microbulbifer salipaludis]
MNSKRSSHSQDQFQAISAPYSAGKKPAIYAAFASGNENFRNWFGHAMPDIIEKSKNYLP